MRIVILVFFLVLSGSCYAQTITPSDIMTAGGFLENCGTADNGLSTKSMNTLKGAPPNQVMDEFKKALADNAADYGMCLGYLAGLHQGWREGHEHGVVAAHLPDGIPGDLSAPLKTMPLDELRAANLQMKSGVPCLPDHTSLGEVKDVVIKYIREQNKTNPLVTLMPTARVVPRALQAAFPCPVSAGTVIVTSLPDGADVNSDGAFVGNTPATLKLNPGKHTVRVSMNGYKDWSKEITVQDGSEVTLNAKLEKP
jgi:hypothetical protein